MARRIWFKEGVFAQFATGCESSHETDLQLKAALETLKERPEAGYKVPFEIPLFRQLPIGEYVAHYIFDENQVEILYLGIPGKC